MKTEQREIKFRAWDSFYKMMIHSSYKDFSVLSEFFKELEGRKENDCVLMQYTGLKDKNGKEIYEGDIVSVLDKTSRENPYIGEVKWNEFVTGFECYPKEIMHSLFLHNPNPEQNLIDELKRFMRYPRTIEIIGNIYERPELLTK